MTKKLNDEIIELKKKIETLENSKMKEECASAEASKKEAEKKAFFAKQLQKQRSAYELEIQKQTNRIESLESSYRSLEDEFRAALTYEAQRYAELAKKGETAIGECERLRASLAQSESSDERNRALIGELNELIKEQKKRLAVLIQFRKENQEDVVKRNSRLNEAVNNAKQLKDQLDEVKKEKSILESSLKKVKNYSVIKLR